MPLLPDDYTPPKQGGRYTKLEEGETELMICDTAIFGYEYWNTDKKPVRSKNHPGELVDLQEGQRVKFFWAMPVWNVTEECFQIWQPTQITLQTELEYLEQSDKWPDPVLGFTISIKRKGKDLETSYSVQANPANERTKAVVDQAKKAYEEAKKNGFDIERLYAGEDPFEPGEKKTD